MKIWLFDRSRQDLAESFQAHLCNPNSVITNAGVVVLLGLTVPCLGGHATKALSPSQILSRDHNLYYQRYQTKLSEFLWNVMRNTSRKREDMDSMMEEVGTMTHVFNLSLSKCVLIQYISGVGVANQSSKPDDALMVQRQQ